MGYILNSPGRIRAKGVAPSSGRPLWRNSMSPYTWATVPVSTTLAQVDPALNPALNPNAVNAAPWRGATGASEILNAWGCLLPAYDANDGRLWMPLGGGHGDYGGNEAYVINLLSESPGWSMVGRPSGNLIDGLISLGDAPGGDYTTGTYVDGRIRSKHSYTDFVHIPGTDKIACMRLTTGFGGGNINSTRCWTIDGVTGEHQLLQNYTALAGRGGNHGGGATWDSNRNCIWHQGLNASGKILKTNPVTGVTTEHGPSDNRIGEITQHVYIPPLDRILLLTGTVNAPMQLFDPNAETWSWIFNASITGAHSAGLVSDARGGAVWVPDLGAVALWDNSSLTTEISLIYPPSTPGGVWTLGKLTAAPENAVTPATRHSRGTFGKFGYSAALKGFYLQTEYAQPLLFFALD